MSFAQYEPIAHPKNSQARNKIDQQREGLDFYDKTTYTKSQEFIQLDSTYYLGYMYEGIYKSERAADVFGYQNAIAPLEKAITLIAKDYDKLLRKRTSDIYHYYSFYALHQDFSIIAYYLENAYAYSHQVEKAYEVIQKVITYNFQKHYALIPYTALAWLVHRNRFFDKKTYSFLANSIEANEKLAHAYLDSANLEIDNNITINSSIFGPKFYESLYLNVDFYRSILYSYNLQIDSAKYYYDILYEKNYVSYNNYATFNAIQGKFQEAEVNYGIANYSGNSDYQLKEFVYYGSILNIYKNDISSAAYELEQTIKDQGSTPGFGWYNLGLARVQMYNGDYVAAEKHLSKAKEFHELHIGTTLGAVHYEFTTKLLELKSYNDQINLEKFNHANWWYRPKSLWKLIKLYYNKYVCEQSVLDLLMDNAERDLVVYSLFSTESTVSWDDIWYVLKDYGHKYFIKKYKGLIETDQRPKIVKYHQLVLAKLLYEQGSISEARLMINEIIGNDTQSEEEKQYEHLFWGRVYELLGLIAEEDDDKQLYQLASNRLMMVYPQLFVTSTLKPIINFQFLDKQSKALKDDIEDYNYRSPASNTATFSCSIASITNEKGIAYNVSITNSKGEEVRKPLIVEKGDLAAQKIINYVFLLDNINNEEMEVDVDQISDSLDPK